MVQYIEYGDIFGIEGVQNYAHGCNCAGAMGKGIAVAFKEKYPRMYVEYKRRCKTGEFRPGDIYPYKDAAGYVFNLGTQVSWTTRAELPAVEQSLRKMMTFAVENGVYRIALPKIGAGLGRLNWEEVKLVIDQVAADYPDVDLYVVENYKVEAGL
ncbi:macro domain-containing protein [Chitinophaga rhizophila]|uniref:Macro domain-containing protein n=1 Tax=Chitinophaga rhizophila TaxID=2866212 RepID=A0ABS7G7K6_9BACT|nr:macro domain-containing protein [Chitinophaga rhizophila]MBW8682712.1 macro domain-containing protein [Chitinophaga rhizophila]